MASCRCQALRPQWKPCSAWVACSQGLAGLSHLDHRHRVLSIGASPLVGKPCDAVEGGSCMRACLPASHHTPTFTPAGTHSSPARRSPPVHHPLGGVAVVRPAAAAAGTICQGRPRHTCRRTAICRCCPWPWAWVVAGLLCGPAHGGWGGGAGAAACQGPRKAYRAEQGRAGPLMLIRAFAMASTTPAVKCCAPNVMHPPSHPPTCKRGRIHTHTHFKLVPGSVPLYRKAHPRAGAPRPLVLMRLLLAPSCCCCPQFAGRAIPATASCGRHQAAARRS